MEYKKAAELKKTFAVHGHFYDLDIGGEHFPCRSELRIQRITSELTAPQAVVVMINPGSSVPLDKEAPIEKRRANGAGWNDSKQFIQARPDGTQYQIMRLMLLREWSCVRVVNLSDLRNGNSSKFVGVFRNAAGYDPSSPHGLTHPFRKGELKDVLKSTTGTVIGAWGQIAVLSAAATAILGRCNVIGLPLGVVPNLRHARPMLKTHQLKWLKEMDEVLDEIVVPN